MKLIDPKIVVSSVVAIALAGVLMSRFGTMPILKDARTGYNGV